MLSRTFAQMRWQLAQRFEKWWWIQYLKSKNTDEYLKWKKQYWRDFLQTLSVKPNGYVLDAGCGPAGIYIILKGMKVKAVDPLVDFYNATIEHFKPEDFPAVDFKNIELEQLNDQNTFDQIFCVNAINHVRSVEASLERLYKAGRKSAQLILTTDCHRSATWKFMLRLLPFDILHPHQFDCIEYVRLLENSGWQIVKSHRLKRAFIFDYYAFVCQKN